MKTFAFILLVCVCGALAAPEKKAEEPKRDKRGYLHGGALAYDYPAYSGYYGGNLGYAGHGAVLGYGGYGYGGNLGYAGYGGHVGYGSYVAPAAEVVATKVIAAPAVSVGAYPYAAGGYYGHGYGAGYGGYGLGYGGYGAGYGGYGAGYGGHGVGWW